MDSPWARRRGIAVSHPKRVGPLEIVNIFERLIPGREFEPGDIHPPARLPTTRDHLPSSSCPFRFPFLVLKISERHLETKEENGKLIIGIKDGRKKNKINKETLQTV